MQALSQLSYGPRRGAASYGTTPIKSRQKQCDIGLPSADDLQQTLMRAAPCRKRDLMRGEEAADRYRMRLPMHSIEGLEGEPCTPGRVGPGGFVGPCGQTRTGRS